ncbi:MAG TPA: hypothetical protein PLV52_01245 [Candidatus Omnitrophota bacterium]|nr:hypothetical protein [Candidatus Omnitrophota bacterium]
MLRKIFIVVLVSLLFFQSYLYGDGPFELTVQVFGQVGYENVVYYNPPGNVIRVRRGAPVIPFKVVLKNISSSTQSLNIGSGSGGSSYGAKSGITLITFETTDENGNTNVVTKKVELGQSRGESYIYMAPGKTKEFEIMLSPNEWNNAFKLADQGATRIKARVSYKSGSTTIYSDYYTIIIEG